VASKQRHITAKKGGPGNPDKIKPHQWRKGQPSPNPKGRAKGESLTTKIRNVLTEPDADHGTKADKLIATAVTLAQTGDFRFFKEIIDRLDGKVPDRIADADGEALKVIVEYRDQCLKSD
jgi:hypothetical protein